MLEPESPEMADASVSDDAARPFDQNEEQRSSLENPADSILKLVSRLQESTERGFAEILQVFQEKLAFDEFKEQQIARLHTEVQGYKTDLIAKATRPLVDGMIRFHGDVGKILEALRKQEPSTLTPERFFKVVEGLMEDVELLLQQSGIEAYREPGNIFVPQRQKAVRTVPTQDPSLPGCIAERLRPGFEQDVVILQKERVAVFVASANLEGRPAAPKTDSALEG